MAKSLSIHCVLTNLQTHLRTCKLTYELANSLANLLSVMSLLSFLKASLDNGSLTQEEYDSHYREIMPAPVLARPPPARRAPPGLTKSPNIKLLVKYEQSGKTRIVLNGVQDHSFGGGQNVLSIIFCDNNLLLTTATTLRAATHSSEAGRPGLIKEGTINSGATTNPKYHHWKAFEGVLDGGDDKSARKQCIQAIRDGDVNTIICCGHKRRFEDIRDMVDKLSPDGFLFNIHIDEADKILTPQYRIDLVNSWQANPQVMSVELITATPFKPDKGRDWTKMSWLGDKFGPTLSLTKQNEMFGEGYHLLSNSDFVPFSKSGSPAEYAEAYLNKRGSPKPGEIWFIPGSILQKSHDDVEDMCLSSGKFDAVIKLNGKSKTIRWKDRTETLDIPGMDENTLDLLKYTTDRSGKVSVIKTKEVKDWLSEYYAKVDGKKFRFAITGCICISRGITISHEDCPITHAIVAPSCYTAARICELKQLISRVSGYAYTSGYKPRVITSNLVWNMCIGMENVVTALEKIAMSDNPAERVATLETVEGIVRDLGLATSGAQAQSAARSIVDSLGYMD